MSLHRSPNGPPRRGSEDCPPMWPLQHAQRPHQLLHVLSSPVPLEEKIPLYSSLSFQHQALWQADTFRRSLPLQIPSRRVMPHLMAALPATCTRMREHSPTSSSLVCQHVPAVRKRAEHCFAMGEVTGLGKILAAGTQMYSARSISAFPSDTLQRWSSPRRQAGHRPRSLVRRQRVCPRRANHPGPSASMTPASLLGMIGRGNVHRARHGGPKHRDG